MKNKMTVLVLVLALCAGIISPIFGPRVVRAEGETAADESQQTTTDGEQTTPAEGEQTETTEVVSPSADVPSPEEPLFEKSGTVKPGEEISFDMDVTYWHYITYFDVTSDKDAAGTIVLTAEEATEPAYTIDFSTKLAEGEADTADRKDVVQKNLSVKKYTGVLKFTETDENKGQSIKYTIKIHAGSAYVNDKNYKSIEIKGPGEYARRVTVGYKTSFKVLGTATDSVLTYKSSNVKIAKVDKTGKIKGIKKGKAVISVSGTDERGNAFTFKVNITVKTNVYTHSKISPKKVSKKNPTAEVIKAYFKNGNLLIDLQVYNPRKYKLISMRNVEVKVYDANDKLVGSVKQIYLPTNLGKKKSGIYTLTILKKDLKKKKADIGCGSVSMSGFKAGY